jgi:hypothetical protein
MAGSDLARQRLQTILQTIAGQLSVPQACRQLSIGEAAFYKLRSQVLQSALQSLEPAAVGRPRQATDQDPEVGRLQQEVTQLRIDLRASQIREEIALLMPHLLKDRKAKLKKTKLKINQYFPEQISQDDPPSAAGKRGWWRGWGRRGGQ